MIGLRDRLPPQNMEAEQGVLGSLLLDPEAINDVADEVDPEDFHRDAHQILFRAIHGLWEKGGRFDAVILADDLKRQGHLADIGGEDYLAEVIASVPHAANAKFYAQMVRQKAIARQVVEMANETLQEAYSDALSADDLLASCERRVMAIGEKSARDEAVTIAGAAAASLYRLRCRMAGENPGVSTGFDDLDAILDGLQPRKLYVLAARPSIGKSALALNVADHVAALGSVLFASIEMDRLELGDRFLMARTGITGDEMRRPKYLDRDQLDNLARVVDMDARKSKLVIDDPSSLTLTQFCAQARRHKSRNGLSLLVVDYLQLIDAQAVKGEIREQQVARISRQLKCLARELRCPVLALCQLNRMIENREERKPRLADLRESGQIEQDADAVMLLHRPDAYDPKDQPGVANVIVAKNRGGRTGTISLRFLRDVQRFETLPPEL